MKKIIVLVLLFWTFLSCKNKETNTDIPKEKFSYYFFLDSLEFPIDTAIIYLDSLDNMLINRDLENFEPVFQKLTQLVKNAEILYLNMYVPKTDSAIFLVALHEIKTIEQALHSYNTLYHQIITEKADEKTILEELKKINNQIYRADSLFGIEFDKFVLKHKLLRKP